MPLLFFARLQRSYDEGNDFDWQDKPDEIAAAILRKYPATAKRAGAEGSSNGVPAHAG